MIILFLKYENTQFLTFLSEKLKFNIYKKSPMIQEKEIILNFITLT